MKEEQEKSKKGQVLIFFLVFMSMFSVLVITVGIDIFRVSQSKILLQTALDGRALHIMSLYAKQLNFIADLNKQMIGKKYDDATNYISRSTGDPDEIWDDFDTLQCPAAKINHRTHSEGGYGEWDCKCAPEDEVSTSSPPSISGAQPGDPDGDGYGEVSENDIWRQPPPASVFDPPTNRAFPTIKRADEYRDVFLTLRTDLQQKAVEKIGKDGWFTDGLIPQLADKKIQLGTAISDGSPYEVGVTFKPDNAFNNYVYSYWNGNDNRKLINLPYIVWDQNVNTWTHSYTSGTVTGQTCTVNQYWYTWSTSTAGTSNVPAWYELSAGDTLGGKIRVSAGRTIEQLKFGSADWKNIDAKSIVELDISAGSIWPDPEPGFKIKFTDDESGL